MSEPRSADHACSCSCVAGRAVSSFAAKRVVAASPEPPPMPACAGITLSRCTWQCAVCGVVAVAAWCQEERPKWVLWGQWRVATELNSCARSVERIIAWLWAASDSAAVACTMAILRLHACAEPFQLLQLTAAQSHTTSAPLTLKYWRDPVLARNSRSARMTRLDLSAGTLGAVHVNASLLALASSRAK
jgi:hypothetical protein